MTLFSKKNFLALWALLLLASCGGGGRDTAILSPEELHELALTCSGAQSSYLSALHGSPGSEDQIKEAEPVYEMAVKAAYLAGKALSLGDQEALRLIADNDHAYRARFFNDRSEEELRAATKQYGEDMALCADAMKSNAQYLRLMSSSEVVELPELIEEEEASVRTEAPKTAELSPEELHKLALTCSGAQSSYLSALHGSPESEDQIKEAQPIYEMKVKAAYLAGKALGLGDQEALRLIADNDYAYRARFFNDRSEEELRAATKQYGEDMALCADAMKSNAQYLRLMSSEVVELPELIEEEEASVRTEVPKVADAAAWQKYFPWNPDAPEVVKTGSGLQYAVLASGEAAGASPVNGQFVRVHYEGRLAETGALFDSSYERGEPEAFPSNGLIEGWGEALALMKPGDRWMVYVPANLAYGAEGTPGGPIPPNAPLQFEVELLSVRQ